MSPNRNKVGITMIKVGITKIKVGITKHIVGITKTNVGYAKNKAGITKNKVDILKNKSSPHQASITSVRFRKNKCYLYHKCLFCRLLLKKQQKIPYNLLHVVLMTFERR
jgi:hypothetical protein